MRTLRRQNDDVFSEEESYLDDRELADLCVFLLKSNDARRAVELTSDLREIIMRPIDMAAIEAEIKDLQPKRNDSGQ